MDRMNYPRGLIRYSSENGFNNGWDKHTLRRRIFRPRVLIYGGVLLLITVAFVASVSMRKPFKVDVIRDRGALARMVGNGVAENVYRLQVMNTTEATQRYQVNVLGLSLIHI